MVSILSAPSTSCCYNNSVILGNNVRHTGDVGHVAEHLACCVWVSFLNHRRDSLAARSYRSSLASALHSSRYIASGPVVPTHKTKMVLLVAVYDGGCRLLVD